MVLLAWIVGVTAFFLGQQALESRSLRRRLEPVAALFDAPPLRLGSRLFADRRLEGSFGGRRTVVAAASHKWFELALEMSCHSGRGFGVGPLSPLGRLNRLVNRGKALRTPVAGWIYWFGKAPENPEPVLLDPEVQEGLRALFGQPGVRWLRVSWQRVSFQLSGRPSRLLTAERLRPMLLDLSRVASALERLAGPR
jgi:hypothetical protein